MSYTDPNDPMERRVDPIPVDTRSDSGVTWFIVGALVIAAGVLAYLYFGENNTTAQNTAPPAATEAPADTGRAATPAAPAEPAAPAAPAPATPAPQGGANTSPPPASPPQ